MGGPMAENLIKKGHSVVVYDINNAAVDQLVSAGAVAATSPKVVASQCDQLLTMLRNSEQVMQCYSDPDTGVLMSVQPGTLLLDSSTIAPEVSKKVAALATNKSAVYMDAPVSGGVNASKAGSLTFMVGGPEKEFTAAKELLSCMGKNIVHCGDVGTGQAAKICNNMLLAISMIGTSETMNLGMRAYFNKRAQPGPGPEIISQHPEHELGTMLVQ
ncbi:hypothetical protein HAZT_HAZT000914 [Hyalella azteca]|uniref:3-hydroxyisobutyrate dehydrogenase n=1 Tax=Hyalella azteca TaxID=294128 RepID=A0A6A0H928_HYAAZ|nr:hypothetical protein HAZT_HAZT000914 [Hyalella azteca]